jgi:hypothetical protein
VEAQKLEWEPANVQPLEPAAIAQQAFRTVRQVVWGNEQAEANA